MALPSLRQFLLLVLAALAFSLAFYKSSRAPAPAPFQWPTQILDPDDFVAKMRTRFVSPRQNVSTHAASLLEMNDGRIRAFWFSGSREGAADVEIRTAVFDPELDKWSDDVSIVDRNTTQRALLRFVKKIGNPVPLRTPDGTLQLFYVTVSVGGWAGSSITVITSTDEGTTWGPPRRLVTSPFINISTLVKGSPFAYNDRTIGLPVYHEFIGKFGELLRLSPSGEVIDKQRLSSGRLGIQPVMLIKNQQQAIILMRHTGTSQKRVIATATADAGRHWSAPELTTLANPDAAVSGVALSDGRILVALNDTEMNREVLSLAASSDGGASWKTIYVLEDQREQITDPVRYLQLSEELARATDSNITDPSAYAASAQRNKCTGQSCQFEFSYPYMIQTRNGDLHLVYTWNRSFIKHVSFSSTWLIQRLNESAIGTSPNAQLH